MARLLRGEIRWADLGGARGHGQKGHHPVLILSHDVFNRLSGTVIAVALTSQEPRAGFPLTVPLGARITPRPSWVRIGQLRTLSTDRIHGRLGTASALEVERVLDGLLEILGR